MTTTIKQQQQEPQQPTQHQQSSSTSQPESLEQQDLDYDNWQGQFEFVGPLLNESTISDCSNNNNNFDDDDLNFTTTKYDTNQPVLIDDETFLSLQPSDFDNSGPHSNLFIEDHQPNDYNNSTTKLINFNNVENFNNVKNNLKNNNIKFMSENNNNSEKLSFNNNNNNNINNKISFNKMNGIKSELCDNLTEQLELLQKQVTNLADSHNIVEDRTTRTKTEYAVLQARYHMLEEQLRESELRSDERLADEQKRHREFLARVEREAQLQNENCQIRIKTIELEACSLRDEVQRLRIQLDKQAADIDCYEEKLEITRENLVISQQDLAESKGDIKKYLAEKKSTDDLMIELGKEIERLRSENGPAMPATSPEVLRLEELHLELEELRQTNKNLEETNEELQAMVLTRGVEEGRNLLNGTSNSLAKELEEMSQSQDVTDTSTLASLSQLQLAYQEKEDENLRLKHYIDTILLNIVENYPQLLEVKSN